MQTCANLKVNQSGYIKNVFLDDKKISKLFHLGVRKGEKITCKFLSPFQSPIAYQVQGTIVGIRKKDAEKIEVEIC